MLSPLDFNTANLASHSNNNPKRVLAFIEEHIERLNRVEPTLNIMHTPRYDEARICAQVYREGPLRGSSFVIAPEDIHPESIHPLIDNGAIPIAEVKTNHDPLNIFNFNNPWNLHHTAGSSAAAAVSSGAAVFSICSDQHGSLILSANFCGTFALRPTSTASRYGWHARSVDDLASIFSCASGQPIEPDPPPISVWYMTDFSPYTLEKPVRNIMHDALTFLQQQSLCFPIETPLFSQAFSIWASNWTQPKDYLPKHPTGLMAQMMHERLHKLNPALGKQLSLIRDDIREGLIQLLGTDGVLICPSYPRCVPQHTSGNQTPMDFILSAFFCDLDLPALQVPMGFCTAGTPLGLQIIASPNQEKNLFVIGKMMEAEFKGWTRSQPFLINMPFNP